MVRTPPPDGLPPIPPGTPAKSPAKGKRRAAPKPPEVAVPEELEKTVALKVDDLTFDMPEASPPAPRSRNPTTLPFGAGPPQAPSEDEPEPTVMLSALLGEIGDEPSQFEQTMAMERVPGLSSRKAPQQQKATTKPTGSMLRRVPVGPKRDLAGELIGDRYRLLEPLGEGAVGVVYRAEHTLMKKQVAVKVLHPATSRHPAVTERFIGEARALAQIGHRHVCHATDFGQTADGEFYLVMEFLEGRTLSDLMQRERRVAPDRAVFIVEQMCAGLAACHYKGIVHRDLKPENVMLVEADGYPDTVKLFDFGIAHVVEQDAVQRRDTVMGTVEYMAPEQALGDAVDARTDLYALGVMLFELLTGRLPFEHKDPLEVLRSHIEEYAPDVRDVAPDAGIPEALADVVRELLSKRPSDRIQSADELKARLGRVWAGASQASSGGSSVDVMGFWQRATTPLKAAIVGVPVLIAVLALAFSGGDTPEPAVDAGSMAVAAGGVPASADEVGGSDEEDDAKPEPDDEDDLEIAIEEPEKKATPQPEKPKPEAQAKPDTAAVPDKPEVADTPPATPTEPPPTTGTAGTTGTPPATAQPTSTAAPPGGTLSPEQAVAALPEAKLILENLRTGNANVALTQLQGLVAKAPQNAAVHYLLGKASSATSDDVGALAGFRKAIELDARYAADQTLVDTVMAFIDLPDDPTTETALKLITDHLAAKHSTRLATVAMNSGLAQSRERAVRILQDAKQLDRIAPWQKSAVLLRQAATCEQRKPHVLQLGTLGNKKALTVLSTMANSRRGCGPTGGDDCHACMRTDLDRIVAELTAK